jgi:hypothetical protein
MPHLQRLQTILATSDAVSILKRLPHDLHPYVFKFIVDEVKVHYWMEKYDWTDTLHYLGEYYDGFQIVSSYFHYLTDTDVTKSGFLHEINAYREKDKWRDASGAVISVSWSWNDDLCDYPVVYDRIGGMIYKQYKERRDMNGLYKLLAHFISLCDDIEDGHGDDGHMVI